MTHSHRKSTSALGLLTNLAIFTALVPGTVTVWLPLFYLYPDIRHRALTGLGPAVAGVVVMAIGAAGYLWCALDFAFFGKGTPAPIHMPKVLVMRGLYRFSRNPMYVSVLLILAGEGVFFWSTRLLEYTAMVFMAFHIFVLLQEEPALRKKMGIAYEQYRQDVPRWIPRLKRVERTDAL
jgi:protein-S-isoprenylcysteine O-methyltransferase Ste14